MQLCVRGLHYSAAPLSVRERFKLDAEARNRFYQASSRKFGGEVVLLCTCNRVELYCFGADCMDAELISYLERECGAAWPIEHEFKLMGSDAARHLFSVTSALNSQVLGDAQILAQVKELYQNAFDCGCCGKVLNRLFQGAFRTGKRVRTETDLCRGGASISSAVIRAAESMLGTVKNRKILLVGAGRMGTVAAQAAFKRGGSELTVVSRTLEHARDLAERYNGRCAPWTALYQELAKADLAIVATGAAHPIVQASGLIPHESTTLIIDISVPRNVEPECAAVPGYHLHDIETLSEQMAAAMKSRAAAMPAATQIVDQELAQFSTWLEEQQLVAPLLAALSTAFDRAREKELDIFSDLLPEDLKPLIEELTRRLTQRVLDLPLARVKELKGEQQIEGHIKVLSQLFN